MKALIRSFAVAILGAAMLFVPPPSATAAASMASPVQEAECILPPGAYGIVNSRGELVGLLIVYPNCTYEIVSARRVV